MLIQLKKIIKLVLISSIASVFLLNICEHAQADNKNATLSVKPLFSGLPVEQNSGYFKLNVNPYTHYNIPLLIINNTEHYVNSKTDIKGASTSDNGNIVYNKNRFSILSSIANKRIIKYRLKPYSSKVIYYSIYTPQYVFHGTQLAGIITHFYNNEKGISNSISYINGVSLTEHKIKRDINLLKPNKLSYDFNNSMYKLNINNNNPILFRNLKAKVIIHGTHSKTYRFNNVNIAPNSNFSFELPARNLGAKLENVSIYFNNKLIQKNNIKKIYILILFSLVLFGLVLLISGVVINVYKKK